MTVPSSDKLPGDDAPPIEPPPYLKERIMAVVRAEARAQAAGHMAREIPATVSVEHAPAGEARLLLLGDHGTLEAHHLPPAPEGAAYRLWLLRGAAPPRLPEPGPLVEVGPDGRGRWELGGLRGVHEVLVAVEQPAPAPRRTLLRVRLPPII
ncbi:MAG: hypothetical protein MUC84_02145 [Solirubrobacteraceae bacterium]|jgi:hypothetical protein|nr:hypothetical protein [Solirubrobacteraceae bacterium]